MVLGCKGVGCKCVHVVLHRCQRLGLHILGPPFAVVSHLYHPTSRYFCLLIAFAGAGLSGLFIGGNLPLSLLRFDAVEGHPRRKRLTSASETAVSESEMFALDDARAGNVPLQI